MVTLRESTPRSGLVLRYRRRRQQRGAAVFIVVMMITMLMGIGLFAARSATLSTSASGFERQMTQTHYITQYGLLVTTAEMSTPRKGAYIDTMKMKPDPLCSQGVLAAKVPNYTCTVFLYGLLEQQMQLNNSGQTFITPPNVASKIPGSLGVVDLEPLWYIEMSDFGPASGVAGMPQGPPGQNPVNLKYAAVTLTATGQIRPRSGGPVPTLTSATTASIETTRVRLTVGPMSL
jgi:hypothetical protein